MIKKIIMVPVLGSMAEAVATVLEKQILRRYKIETRAYNTFSFMTIVLGILLICFPLSFLFPSIISFNFSERVWELKNIIILLAVIFFSILANLFTFYAFKWEKLTELEPMRLMQPLFTILLALIFYASERQTQMHVLIAAIIASLALIFSHVRKHHFSLNKYAISAIAGSFFFALELTLSKSILSLYSPISFYLIRCTGIFLFSLIIFKPHIEKIKPKVKLMVTGVGIIWILYRILLYMSYQSKGLITTTLLFILAPIFIYTLSYFYLREKLNLRNIIASVIIVLCVVYAMFYSIVSTN